MKSSVFSSKARDYALYRPQYAPDAIEALFNLTGVDSTWNVADIGSGTGNVSRHFVDKVSKVFGVEPEQAMRHEAELLLSKYSSFKSISGTAEKTTLDDNSIDLITVGQASHWIDWEKAQNEFDRILKTHGCIALIWNQYETTPEIAMDFIFNPETVIRRSYPVVFSEEWTEYIGGIRSASRNPSPGEEGYKEFEDKLRKRFDSQSKDGNINVKYTTELLTGRLGQRSDSRRII